MELRYILINYPCEYVFFNNSDQQRMHIKNIQSFRMKHLLLLPFYFLFMFNALNDATEFVVSHKISIIQN